MQHVSDAPQIPVDTEGGFIRRALIVEDDAFTRSLVGHLLEHAGFEVLLCGSSAEGIDAFEAFDPDVLIVDVQLGAPPNGAQLAQALRQRAPHLGIVVISNFPSADASGLGQGLPQGAAFLHKREIESPNLLIEAIDSALIDSAAEVVLASSDQTNALSRLSPNQLGILQQIALGQSNAEIARQRDTTLRSVERMVSRTFAALGVADDPSSNARVAATRIYIEAMGVPHTDA